MNRKIVVPGVALNYTTIITDAANNAVIAIPHSGEVIVVFFSKDKGKSVRVMTTQQADKFSKDLIRAHQAINDDAKIAQMEKEFGEDGT